MQNYPVMLLPFCYNPNCQAVKIDTLDTFDN